MALSRMTHAKRPTPAEQAETFKAAQEQMKADGARRRLEAEDAPKDSKRRRRS